MSVIQDFGAMVVQAWQGDQPFADVLTHAASLEAAGNLELSAVLYQTWLKRTDSPYTHAVLFNLGATLSNLGDHVGAEEAYVRAIALAPSFVHPHLNLGLIHERNAKQDDAIAEYRWIVANSPRDEHNTPVLITALNNLGRVLENQKKLLEATDYLEQSLALNPDQPDALHHWVFLRERLCLWPVYKDVAGVTKEAMIAATSALAMLGIQADPAEQLAAARRYVDTKLAKDLPRLSNPSGYAHQKIRIAYLSSDFSCHPVSLLTAQMYELHDRQKFEVFGFCWSPEDGSKTRQRVIAAMDHFIRINEMGDEEAAKLIRHHEIDILVDLQGQTAGARANILGYRPAPIQITYLGLPATTGLPSIDYVIADKFLIPPEQAQFYSETPLYMPHIYQVSDRLREAGPTPTRAIYGVPEQAFVFCSFNNSFKYTPDVFAVWMNLLKRVSNSVLWLLADNQWAEESLRREAASHGIGAERLIFAGRVSPENYLARFQIADLFLDSYPFNAGTTANDCLWMGCPIVTLTGKAFGSRMAGALLTAAELPELITYDLQTYEETAAALAEDPARCQRLREHLAYVRESGVLFDTPKFVRDLEERLIGLVRALRDEQQAQTQEALAAMLNAAEQAKGAVFVTN